MTDKITPQITPQITPLTLHDAQHAIATLQAAIQKLLDGLNAEIARGQEFLDYNTGGPLMFISVLEEFRQKCAEMTGQFALLDTAIEGLVDLVRALHKQLDTVTNQRDYLIPPDAEDDPKTEE